MPNLPAVHFKHIGPSGDMLEFDASVNVGKDGIFSIRLPNETFDRSIEEFAAVSMQGFSIAKFPGVTRAHAQGALRVYAPNLALGTAFIRALVEYHLSAEITRDDVLAYRYVSGVHYWRAPGDIFPHGGGQLAGEWRGCQTGPSTEVRPNYTIGFVAYALVRKVAKRGDTERVTFERWKGDKVDAREKLNGFVGLDWAPIKDRADMRGFRVIPYTPAAADFMLNTMLSLCRVDDRLGEFFADEANVTRAIESGAPLQIT